MARQTIVFVSIDLHEKLIKAVLAQQKKHEEDSEVFLLGRNDQGVLVEGVSLTNWVDDEEDRANDDADDESSREDGCHWMASISTNSLAKAYVKLSKKGLVPTAFANVNNDSSHNGESQWGSDYGDAIYNHPDMAFITYGNEFTMAQINHKGSVYELEIALVAPSYKAKRPAVKKSTKKDSK